MADLTDGGPASARAEVVQDSSPPVIRLSGELDISNVESIHALVEPVLAGTPDQLVFDLSALEFMDSSGIALLISVAGAIPRVELRNRRRSSARSCK